MDEIYRDWILPFFATEIVKEHVFMEELSADEMEMVVEKVMINKTNEFKKNMILGLQEIDEDIVSLYEDKVREDVVKKGSKRFFKILKDEMKGLDLSVLTNIAGKQKNLAAMTDKMVNIFREIMGNPQLRGDSEAMKIFNQILQGSGLDEMNIAAPVQPQQIQPPQGQPAQPASSIGGATV